MSGRHHRPAAAANVAGKLRVVGTAAVVVAALGALAVVSYWMLTGGRWYVVETPSMGTSAPVGTLLWVHPVPASELHPGEFVTVQPPGSNSTFSHRIYRMYPNGTFSTKGQITSPDPWRLRPKNVVGKVEMRWWGVGWAIKAAPLLLLGGLALMLLSRRFAPPHLRLPIRTIGGALLGCIATVVYRPLAGAVQLGVDGQNGGGGRATYIATGLLPLRLSAPGSGSIDLRAGQVGTIVSKPADKSGHFPIGLHPHVPLWWWAVLVVLCFIPALWSTLRPGQSRAAPPQGTMEA